MADANTQPTPSTQATTQLLNDLQGDRDLGLKLLAAYKTGGIKALIPLLPDVEQAVEKEIPVAQQAFSEVKAGYKTTEFWLTVGVVLGNVVYYMISGKSFPLDVNATMVAVTGLYAVVRTLIKK